jgi:hypothetical protein
MIRRSILLAGAGLVAAPALARAGSLMPVSPDHPPFTMTWFEAFDARGGKLGGSGWLSDDHAHWTMPPEIRDRAATFRIRNAGNRVHRLRPWELSLRNAFPEQTKSVCVFGIQRPVGPPLVPAYTNEEAREHVAGPGHGLRVLVMG